MPADTDEEVFEVVDSDNKVVGRELRGECHAKGLCHRAVYCFVFDQEEKLLLQQRSSRKKIGAGEWDLSLAEHLQPGEAYVKAVVRGLREELGIEADQSDIEGPLSPAHLRVLDIPGIVKDVEYVQAFRLRGWSGSLKPDPDEVQAVRWLAVTDLCAEVTARPGSYTPWLRGELKLLGDSLLGSGAGGAAEVPAARTEHASRT